jgi:hypothetical protein
MVCSHLATFKSSTSSSQCRLISSAAFSSTAPTFSTHGSIAPVQIRPKPSHCSSSRTARDFPAHRHPARHATAPPLPLLDTRSPRPCRASTPSAHARAACVIGPCRACAVAARLHRRSRESKSQDVAAVRPVVPAPARAKALHHNSSCARAVAPPVPAASAPA